MHNYCPSTKVKIVEIIVKALFKKKTIIFTDTFFGSEKTTSNDNDLAAKLIDVQ